MDRIIQQLTISRNVFIASHENPDGDAIGSLLATGLALSALGKRTTLYNESQIPAVYRFLPSVDAITRSIHAPDDFDTAIILDCGDLNRIGKAAPEAGFIANPFEFHTLEDDHHVD